MQSRNDERIMNRDLQRCCEGECRKLLTHSPKLRKQRGFAALRARLSRPHVRLTRELITPRRSADVRFIPSTAPNVSCQPSLLVR